MELTPFILPVFYFGNRPETGNAVAVARWTRWMRFTGGTGGAGGCEEFREFFGSSFSLHSLRSPFLSLCLRDSGVRLHPYGTFSYYERVREGGGL